MNSEFFGQNRRRVLEVIGDRVMLLSAYDKMQHTHDATAPFIQEANFWWLTGLELPGWRLLIDGRSREVALMRPSLSKVEKLFESYYSESDACDVSGVAQFIASESLSEKLAGRQVYVLKPHTRTALHSTPNPADARIWRQAQQVADSVHDGRQLLSRLRAIKQPAEIAAIEHAIDITVRAFKRTAPLIPQLVNEAEVAAEFTYDFMKQGARHAYEPIVAAGKNACTLHYDKNNAPLEGVVLLDIGARHDGYSADISRTYAYTRPTERQLHVHQELYRAHQAIIALLKPGLSIEAYLKAVDTSMKQALVSLGLIRDSSDTEGYRRYFPHAISHGLGVDVHDSFGGAEAFAEGMVLTVEPGIYIPEEGIGMRIEDDVLITATGHRNLSVDLPVVL